MRENLAHQNLAFGACGKRLLRSGSALLAAGLLPLLAGCEATDFLEEVGSSKLDLPRMEADIRSELQRDVDERSRSASASVTSIGAVSCRQLSEIEARCHARESRGSRSRVRTVEVSVEEGTGRYTWQVVR